MHQACYKDVLNVRRRRSDVEGWTEKVQWRRSNGKGPSQKGHRRREGLQDDGEGLPEKAGRRRLDGEGPTKKVRRKRPNEKARQKRPDKEGPRERVP